MKLIEMLSLYNLLYHIVATSNRERNDLSKVNRQHSTQCGSNTYSTVLCIYKY